MFAGALQSGYSEVASRSAEDIAGHLVTGGSQSVLSGRVSYVLGLQGPTMTIDTACSSSLVACTLRPRRCGRASARWPWPAV